MLTYILKYFFLILTSTYSYFKILNIKNNSIKTNIFHCFFAFTSALFATSFIEKSFLFKSTFIFIMFFIFAKISTGVNLSLSFITSIISFSLSYISLTISGLVIGILLAPSNINTSKFPVIYKVVISSSLQCILLFLLFRIKRLRNGMPFIKNKNFIQIGISICILTILLFIYFYNPKFQLFPQNLLSLFFIFLLAIALLIWWRRKLTQSYVEKLRVSEVETLYKEISDRDLEIEKLHAHNEELGKIIHKDNKLIPAMELAVRSYLQTAALMEPEEAKQMGIELLAKLERMSADRAGIVRTYKENNTFRQRTGVSSIDAIVDFMENKASNFGIEYRYQFDKGIKEKFCAYISEDDFMHLLSEVNDNAIIATTYSKKKVVHVHIGFIQDMLFIDISDSGIPFTPETYQNFGMLQHTTHGDHGGSGIGLMDLAKLKKQYKFSLQIYEYPPDESIYTKKIRLLFDKKNHYLIQSYRAREIRSTVMRNDLHVLQYVDTKK